MENIFLSISTVLFGMFIYSVIKSIIEYKLILKMRKKENELRELGVTPLGSSLAHGMCVNKETGEIEHDQIESISWYKRLAE